MRIYIVRHAETDHNVQKIIQGSLDTSINATGHAQSELLADRLGTLTPSHIFCSDLGRCVETLQHVLDRIKRTNGSVVDAVYTEALRERYMAELQGITRDQVNQLVLETGKAKMDFGESRAALTARVADFWKHHVLPLYADTDGRPHETDSEASNNDAEGDVGTESGTGEERNPRHKEGQQDDGEDQDGSNSGSDSNSIIICSHGGTLLHLFQHLTTTLRPHTFWVPDSLRSLINPKNSSGNTSVTLLETRTMTVLQYADVSHLLTVENKLESATENVDV